MSLYVSNLKVFIIFWLHNKFDRFDIVVIFCTRESFKYGVLLLQWKNLICFEYVNDEIYQQFYKTSTLTHVKIFVWRMFKCKYCSVSIWLLKMFARATCTVWYPEKWCSNFDTTTMKKQTHQILLVRHVCLKSVKIRK